MKNSLLITLICLFTFQLYAAPEITTKKFKVTAFSSLEIGHAFEVHVFKGSTYAVSATGRPEDVENVEVEINNNHLEIGLESTSWSFGWKNNKKVVINITMPTLKSAEFTGACKGQLSGFSDEETVNITLSGASKLDMIQLNADKLNLELSGASHAVASGRVGKLNIEASGASHLNALDLIARDADVEANGASHVDVQVQKTLRIDASGASKVSYKGRPIISKDLSGAASIHPAN